MSNRTYLTLGFDSQPKNGQIVIMLYAFQDILAKYLNSHLPVIVETNPVPSAKVANAAFLAEDILFRSWKQITFHRNRASVLIGGAIKIGWSRTVVQSWHRLFFLYFAQPWVATGQANLIKQAQLKFQRMLLVDLWETNMILKVGKKSKIVQFYALETTVQEG